MQGTPPILAAFVSPALLYAGAAAVSIPILIHLLTRRRFRRIRWAAMEFLVNAERRNRRRLRMEEWILLALRCLAILGIGMFIARPYLTPRGVAAGFGGSRRIERVFVLDDSFSMGYQLPQGGGSPFTRSKLAVSRLVRAIKMESPEDTVTLLRTSDVRNPLALRTFLDARQTDDLLMRVEGLSPSQRSMNSADVIQGLVEVLQKSPDVAGVVAYVISDFQRVDWIDSQVATPSRAQDRPGTPSDSQPSGKKGATKEGEGTGVFAPLAAWAGDDRGLRVVMVYVGDPDAENTAVVELEPISGQIVSGTTGRLRARLANYSSRPAEGLGLELTVGTVPQPVQTLRELGNNLTATMEVDAEFPSPGFEPVRLEIPNDRLPLDNIRHLAVEVTSSIRMLIVNGEPAGEAYDNETTFLSTALRPQGELFSGNELTVIDEAELDSAKLSEFHVVVLANLYRVSDPVADSITKFVRDGGGLVVFLGDQVDPELYNAALYRDGAGILPARLTDVVRAPQAAHLVVVERLHPVVRGLSGEGDPLGLSQVPFFQYYAVEPFADPRAPVGADARAIVAPPTDDDLRMEINTSAVVLARFDDPAERPAIIERRIGRGRVLMVATAADKEWNLWPDHPTFVPVMIEMMHHVAPRGDSAKEQFVGSSIELPVDPGKFEMDALVRTPAYPAEPELGVTAVAAEDGRGFTIHWDRAEAAGVYQFVLRRREGGESVRVVAVNPDPKESDLRGSREEDLRRAFPKLPFEYVQDVDALSGGTGEARTELWRSVLMLTAMVLIGEQFLAWFWGKRR